MPQVIQLKFSERDMPKQYVAGKIGDLKLQDFVVAPREGSEDVGFVSSIEYVSREQLKLREYPYDEISRRASENEKEAFFVRKAEEQKALVLCKAKAIEHKLPIKISTARIDPRNGKHVFQFTSDNRIDFRSLVKDLSQLLKSRIELWQIGVRDEAKAVDGFGACGLRTCCSSWLPNFRPINLRMAKTQDINLPPSKLSGQCGRLLCCLSYEVDQYQEMSKGLLPKGATVKVDNRNGVIIDRNIIHQTYVVRFEDGGNKTLKLSNLEKVQIPDQMKKMADVFRTIEVKEEEKAVEAPVAPSDKALFDLDSSPQESAKSASSRDSQKSTRPEAGKKQPQKKKFAGRVKFNPEEKKSSGDDKEGQQKAKRRGRRGRGRGKGGEKAQGGKQAGSGTTQQNKKDGKKTEEGKSGNRRRGRRGRGREKGNDQNQQQSDS